MILSQRQRLDEHVGSSSVTDAKPGDSVDLPKLEEVKFFPTELHPSSASDGNYSDNDDDDCIDLLASLDISNEANVMWCVVVSKLEC